MCTENVSSGVGVVVKSAKDGMSPRKHERYRYIKTIDQGSSLRLKIIN
jgi:hypothetical protein